MLPVFITKDFIKKFNVLNGQTGNVYIKHLLYGNQKINRCVLHPFVDEVRIGLVINEEEIYITMEELSGASSDETRVIIKSEVMAICIDLL